MKINKYLKELGLKWSDLPGNYSEKLNKRGIDAPAADIRNKEDKEGFCDYEFFSLDYSLNLIIYSKLCYFREHYAVYGVPSCCCSSELNNREKDHQLWFKILDEIIEGFKLAIIGDRGDSEVRYKITHARRLLAEYWDCLWY